MLQPEYRKWFDRVFMGSYIGFQLHYALFNFGGMLPWGFGNGKMLGIENRQIANNRYQGNLAGFGISYGYQWMISPQWNLEAGLSLGYAHLNYKRYGQPEALPLSKNPTATTGAHADRDITRVFHSVNQLNHNIT